MDDEIGAEALDEEPGVAQLVQRFRGGAGIRMLDEVTRFVESGITSDDLALAKQGLQQKFDRDLSSDGFVLQLLAEGLYLERKLDFWAKRYAAIAALNADQVNAAIKRHLRLDALVKITSGDKKKM